jgi:hypothetical protein
MKLPAPHSQQELTNFKASKRSGERTLGSSVKRSANADRSPLGLARNIKIEQREVVRRYARYQSQNTLDTNIGPLLHRRSPSVKPGREWEKSHIFLYRRRLYPPGSSARFASHNDWCPAAFIPSLNVTREASFDSRSHAVPNLNSVVPFRHSLYSGVLVSAPQAPIVISSITFLSAENAVR